MPEVIIQGQRINTDQVDPATLYMWQQAGLVPQNAMPGTGTQDLNRMAGNYSPDPRGMLNPVPGSTPGGNQGYNEPQSRPPQAPTPAASQTLDLASYYGPGGAYSQSASTQPGNQLNLAAGAGGGPNNFGYGGSGLDPALNRPGGTVQGNPNDFAGNFRAYTGQTPQQAGYTQSMGDPNRYISPFEQEQIRKKGPLSDPDYAYKNPGDAALAQQYGVNPATIALWRESGVLPGSSSPQQQQPAPQPTPPTAAAQPMQQPQQQPQFDWNGQPLATRQGGIAGYGANVMRGNQSGPNGQQRGFYGQNDLTLYGPNPLGGQNPYGPGGMPFTDSSGQQHFVDMSRGSGGGGMNNPQNVYGQQFNVPQRPQQMPNPFMGRPSGMQQQPGMMYQQPQQNPYGQDPYAAIMQMSGQYGGGGVQQQPMGGGQSQPWQQQWSQLQQQLLGQQPPQGGYPTMAYGQQQQNYSGYTQPGYGDYVDRSSAYSQQMPQYNATGDYRQPNNGSFGGQQPMPSIASMFGGGASQTPAAPAFDANDPWASMSNRPQQYNNSWNLYGGGGQQATNQNSFQNWR